MCGFHIQVAWSLLYLKMLKEEKVTSDKTENGLWQLASYYIVKRIWVSEPIGIWGESGIKETQLQAGLEDALDLQRIQFSKAVNSGGSSTERGSSPQFMSPPTLPFLSQPSMSHPQPQGSSCLLFSPPWTFLFLYSHRYSSLFILVSM